MTTQSPPDEFAELDELMQNEVDEAVRRDPTDPAVRRARRRRLLIALIVVVALFAAAGGYGAWAQTAQVPAPVESVREPAAAASDPVALLLPAEGASAVSVAGAEEFLGAEASGVWLTSGDPSPRPLASITKLVTALVILEARPLAGADDPGPTITFSKADHDLYDEYYVRGATIAAMPTGSRMTLRDAIATMLIPSASNYADAVSTWAFGSRWSFLGAARDWLARNGLTGTTIVDPTGIDPRNTSTPADLIALGKLAAAHPVISEIVATPSLNVPAAGTLFNTNSLLGTSGITGLKTGNLGEGTHNLVFSATLDVGTGTPLTVIGVVIGGGSRQSVNSAVVGFLDSLRSGFHEVPVAERGDTIGSYSTPWGATADIVVAEDASVFTWSDTPITVSMQTSAPEAYEDGEVVGSITWTAGARSVTADLEIDGDIEPPTTWWRLTNPDQLGG